MSKTCSKCKKIKPEEDFYFSNKKENKIMNRCKKCVEQQKKEYREKNREKILKRDRDYGRAHRDHKIKKSREYYYKNRSKLLEDKKIYAGKNREKIKDYLKEYQKINKEKSSHDRKIYYQKNKEQIKAGIKKWEIENKEHVRRRRTIYERNRSKTDPSYRAAKSLKSRMRYLVKKNNAIKADSNRELVGCSSYELKSHLERQFKKGMTWRNYGVRGWNIDHIKPCSSFDLTDPKQQRECFHYTNLQPLWWWENRAKWDKIDYKGESYA